MTDFLNELSIAVTVGLSLASLFATLIILFSIFTIIYDYKKSVLDARLGIWRYPRKRFSIINAASFPGSILSTYTLGYAIIIIMFGVVLVPISLPLTWKILWAFRLTLLTLLLPAIINSIIKMILKKVMVKKETVKCRRLFGIFELFLLYLGLSAGFVTGLLRFIFMLLVGLISLAKLDVPIIPMWIL